VPPSQPAHASSCGMQLQSPRLGQTYGVACSEHVVTGQVYAHDVGATAKLAGSLVEGVAHVDAGVLLGDPLHAQSAPARSICVIRRFIAATIARRVCKCGVAGTTNALLRTTVT
jgi:hypothetical protein